MVGYVLECGLKACIAKQTKQFDFPPDPATIRDIYVHDLERLVKAAGIKPILDGDLKANKEFEVNWAIVKDWKETSRYEERSENEARNLFDAIADRKNGVLQWVKQHW